jgi:hypothetical protein
MLKRRCIQLGSAAVTRNDVLQQQPRRLREMDAATQRAS